MKKQIVFGSLLFLSYTGSTQQKSAAPEPFPQEKLAFKTREKTAFQTSSPGCGDRCPVDMAIVYGINDEGPDLRTTAAVMADRGYQPAFMTGSPGDKFDYFLGSGMDRPSGEGR